MTSVILEFGCAAGLGGPLILHHNILLAYRILCSSNSCIVVALGGIESNIHHTYKNQAKGKIYMNR